MSASPHARDRVRRIWLTFVGASLALVLLGAAYVQWRQYELLDGTAQYQNDALGWSFFQLETENLRLRSEIQQAITDGRTTKPDSLQLRYDIFVSRVGLVDHERAARIMRSQAVYETAMTQVRAFVAHADRYFGEPAQAALSTNALRELAAELDGLSTPLHDLSLGASHLLYERVAQRNEAVRAQSRHGIALVLFQCVLLLVLAGFAISPVFMPIQSFLAI